MTWSKGHFEEVARIVGRETELARTTWANKGARIAAETTIRDIADEFARIFAQQNPRFDSARFLKACGIDA